MSDERPESLLKSALEKIVYFEARSTQLSNDLERAKSEAERLKAELGQAAQREIELRRVIAELEVRATRAHAEREEAARLTDALRRERADLVGKMLDASRIHGSDQGVDDFDLAQFIATLRSEVLLTRDGPVVAGPALSPRPSVGGAPSPRPSVEAAPALHAGPGLSSSAPSEMVGRGPAVSSSRPSAVEVETVPGALASAAPATSSTGAAVDDATAVEASTAHHAAQASRAAAALAGVTAAAHELSAQGRLSVTAKDLATLSGAQAFPGRSEETLFGFSVRELSAPDAAARARAAERLKALAHPAAAPALAAALHAETDAAVQVALLGAFASLAKQEGVAVVQPLLTSRAPDVRIAALKALLALDAGQVGPHLAAAMSDPDKAVRRRASLLALGLKADEALALGTRAIRDADADVRALAALVLGASQADAARPLLLDAMRDADLRVRRSASQALSKLLGRDVTPLVDLDHAQRRREVRRLAHVPAAEIPSPPPAKKLRERVQVPSPPSGERARERGSPPAAHASPRRVAPVAPTHAVHAAATPARTAVAVLEVEAPAASPELSQGIVRELRAAIRGKPLADLAATLSASMDDTMRACSALMQQGQVVRRGLKYFVA